MSPRSSLKDSRRGKHRSADQREESYPTMATLGTVRPLGRGQSVSALPQESDFDLLGDGEGVVNLDT